MGNVFLFAVTISARQPGVEGPYDRHELHVETGRGALRDGNLALEWLGEGWLDKTIEKIEKVGGPVIVDHG